MYNRTITQDRYFSTFRGALFLVHHIQLKQELFFRLHFCGMKLNNKIITSLFSDTYNS